MGNSSVILVFSATILCALLLHTVRSGLTSAGSVSLSGFDGVGVVILFVAFVLATAVLGSLFGISLIISVMIHELGHVVAYRMLGHTKTRFRLLPLMKGPPNSDTPITRESDAFFVAIMGPALSLAPMVLALSLSVVLTGTAPEIAGYLRVFAATCGVYNFFNLLPIWPLDGGKCARLAAVNFWPGLAPGLTIFICSALAAASLRTGSLALLILAAVGVHSLMRKGETFPHRLGANNALIAMSAYAFTFAAHFSCAWLLLKIYF